MDASDVEHTCPLSLFYVQNSKSYNRINVTAPFHGLDASTEDYILIRFIGEIIAASVNKNPDFKSQSLKVLSGSKGE